MDEKLINKIRVYLDGCIKSGLFPDFEKMTIERKKEVLGKEIARYFEVKNEIINDQYFAEILPLISEYCIVIQKPIVFKKKEYLPWIEKERENINWYFSKRYSEYLLTKKEWPVITLRSMEQYTDMMLDHCGNPRETGFFSYKGLVMGDIQSGKTANYTFLINKSFDAGYKLVIVLAGITNDLRSQTQKRLDSEVLGYKTQADMTRGKAIGVGEISFLEKWQIGAFTYSDENGDLRKVMNSVPLGSIPMIAVIKKNKSVLENMISFIDENPIVRQNDGKLNIPVLVIDDEVDQASVNTRNTRDIDEASTINQLIRQMIGRFVRYSYVGYTATPFANVFISPYSESDPEEKKDIFPEDFIFLLPTPNEYSGIRDYFGLGNEENDVLLDLYEEISPSEMGLMFGNAEGKTNARSTANVLPQSLEKAIIHFFVASAVKLSRGLWTNCSMLVNVTSNVLPMITLKPLIEDFCFSLARDYRYGAETKKALKKYWQENVCQVSKTRLGEQYNDNWENIEPFVKTAFELFKRDNIKVLSGSTDDAIDYTGDPSLFIIIGGAKLSRGLTLEGLIVSYYFRRVRTFDTLMQMGRWFGYRKGWLDLARVWTTKKILRDFLIVAEALETFKNEISSMNKLQLTPADFGLKVRTSPFLVPTSANKMYFAKKQRVGFSGSLQQTINFDLSKKLINLEATKVFLSSLPVAPVKRQSSMVFENIGGQRIIDYLYSYKEPSGIGQISVKTWRDYIEKAMKFGELLEWTVILHSLKDSISNIQINSWTINKPLRTKRVFFSENDDIVSIKVLTNPSDFLGFYTDDNPIRSKIKAFDSNNELIRTSFTCIHGLMSIYVFDLYEKATASVTEHLAKNGSSLVGLGLWFSTSESMPDPTVEYYVNEVYQREFENALREDNENQEAIQYEK